MKHEITGVARGSAAQRYGLRPGDRLIAMNGEPVLDEIDYQALGAGEKVTVTVERANGRTRDLVIRKEDWEPLGLRFGDSMVLKPHTCRNHCVFCFIDQNPPNLRGSLYVKDDDWRFSLMMGNFVTLTNVDEAEFQRIIKRHASPLYVSVHATDPELRCRMMNNRFAGDILTRLTRLRDAGIRFHCQIVCCPGFNDGEVLMKTLADLRALEPATMSVAIVPVGLTRFRENLTKLTPFNAEGARALLKTLEPFQAECRRTIGTTFVFPSDEFYSLSGAPVPDAEWYEGFPQIENGVGMLAKLRQELLEAEEDERTEPGETPPARTYVIISGTSGAPYMKELAARFAPPNATVRVATILNRFFGETVTVTGLLTGGDTLAQLSPEMLAGADAILMTRNMLRHERDLFLDDMPFDEFQRRLPAPVRVVEDGYDLYAALRGRDGDEREGE
jgi:putative radical SAM enzyme (TIGR03279 family)